MNSSFEVPMDEFNAMSRDDQITHLCGYHQCSEKKQKIHRHLFVHKQWNPHPPKRFVDWWSHGGWKDTEEKTDRKWEGIDAVRAFNCEAVRETYREARQVGIV